MALIMSVWAAAVTGATAGHQQRLKFLTSGKFEVAVTVCGVRVSQREEEGVKPYRLRCTGALEGMLLLPLLPLQQPPPPLPLMSP